MVVRPGFSTAEVEWAKDGYVVLTVFIPDRKQLQKVRFEMAARWAWTSQVSQTGIHPAEASHQLKGMVPFALGGGLKIQAAQTAEVR